MNLEGWLNLAIQKREIVSGAAERGFRRCDSEPCFESEFSFFSF